MKRKKSQTTKNTKPNTKKSFFISDNKFDSNEKALQNWIDVHTEFSNSGVISSAKTISYLTNTQIGWYGDERVSEDVMKRILKLIPNTKIAKTQSEIEQTGSSSCPIFNNYWVIGNLGSIWLDVEVDGKPYRVAFYNEKPFPKIGVCHFD